MAFASFRVGLGVIALFVCQLSMSADDVGPQVSANGELLQGAWEKDNEGVAVFKGIPFAAPPVGNLRWHAPVANQPRQGLQSALEFAPACMQTTYTTDWYAGVAREFGHGPESAVRPNGVSEDCLYLNIWSPRLDTDAQLPVLVWVHGGSNRGGWSYEPNYIGKQLAAKGVIVVTIAYRLGIFGFFSHPALDNGPGEAVANFGWLDSTRAFRWVADNISAFGGDPDNITAIGESSGAGDISDWIATDIADSNLYSRSIIQSPAGSLGPRRTLADEKDKGRQLIASLGFSSKVTSEQLRKISAADLLKAQQTESGHYFQAVIDGLTLRLRPLDSIRQLDSFKMDVLIGTNADEWYMYIDKDVNHSDLEKLAEELDSKHAAVLLDQVQGETDIRRAMGRIKTAADTLCPSRYLAAKATELGGRGWVYYFTRQRPGPGGENLGAYHGTEIPYVFNMHDNWLPTEKTDRELTETMMDYWVQFARSGNPNLPGHPDWPIYKASEPKVMELGDHVGTMIAHDQVLCELLGPDAEKNKPGVIDEA